MDIISSKKTDSASSSIKPARRNILYPMKTNSSSGSRVLPKKEVPAELFEAPASPIKDKDNGRERLKRHREEVAGQVIIPDKWSEEKFLKEWMDYSSFDKLLAPKGLSSAREALIAEGRRATSQRLRIESRCF